MDHSIKHKYRNMTKEERLEQLRQGHLPDTEDLVFVIKDYEEYLALRKYANVTLDARQFLPKDF
jgi:hypothetical protein